MRQKCRQWRQGFTRLFIGRNGFATGCLRGRKVGLALHGLIHGQCHRVFAKTFLRDKTLCCVHQLLQVLHPVCAFALGLVVLDQLAVVQHQFNDLPQCLPLCLLAQHIDLGDKGRDVGACFAADGADRIVQWATMGAGRVLELLDAARTNATRREIDHPQKAGVVARVL